MLILAIDWMVILAYVILVPFILLNIALILGKFLEGRITEFARKILKIEIPYEKEKERMFNLIYTIIWLVIGIIGVLMLDNPISLGGFMVFIAFRGGANLGKRTVFGFHDSKLIHEATSDTTLIGIVSFAFKLGLIVEVLFLLAWGLLYKFLSLTIKVAFGLSTNSLMFILWFSGLIFGLGFGIFRSRLAKSFLLKDEIAIVLLFTGKALEEALKTKIKFGLGLR